MLTALGVLGVIWLLRGGLNGPADTPAWNVPAIVRGIDLPAPHLPVLRRLRARFARPPRCPLCHRRHHRHRPALLYVPVQPTSPAPVYPSPQSPLRNRGVLAHGS